MTDRMYYVYALLDPETEEPFYIGCSIRPYYRLKQHGTDPGSSAYERVRKIYAAGRKPFLSIISSHSDKAEARAVEDRLIRSTPRLENISHHPRGCRCGKQHGLTEEAMTAFHADFARRGIVIKRHRRPWLEEPKGGQP